MLGFIRQPSRSAGAAITYITVGSLAMIWAGIWYYYMNNPNHHWSWYVCTGLLLSGFDLVVIGLFFGRLGQQAKGADTTGQVVAPSVPVQAPVQPAVMPQGAVMPQPGMVPQAQVAQAPVAQAVPPTVNT